MAISQPWTGSRADCITAAMARHTEAKSAATGVRACCRVDRGYIGLAIGRVEKHRQPPAQYLQPAKITLMCGALSSRPV
jgi:hypothetical protein